MINDSSLGFHIENKVKNEQIQKIQKNKQTKKS